MPVVGGAAVFREQPPSDGALGWPRFDELGRVPQVGRDASSCTSTFPSDRFHGSCRSRSSPLGARYNDMLVTCRFGIDMASLEMLGGLGKMLGS